MEKKKIVVVIISMFLLMVSSAAAERHVQIKYERAIEKGVSYLVSTQMDSYGEKGEFAVFESFKRDMSRKGYIKCNFATPLGYHSLGFLENLPLKPSTLSNIKTIRQKSINFILNHKEIDNYDDPNVIGNDVGGAVWRHLYGSDVSTDAAGNVRPWAQPDIDDTAIALQALFESGENIDDYFPTTAVDYFTNYQLRDSYKNQKIFHFIKEVNGGEPIKTDSTSFSRLKPASFVMKKLLSMALSFLYVPPEQLKFNSFDTWIHGETRHNIFEMKCYDPVVNANVLFFYSTQLNESDLLDEPGLLDEISEVFDYVNYACDKMYEHWQTTIYPLPWGGNALFTRIYNSPLIFTYFISRAYKDGGAPITGSPSIDLSTIKDFLLADDDYDGQPDCQKSDGSWGNFEQVSKKRTLVTGDIETAFATLSLLNIYDTFDASEKVMVKSIIDKSIDYLVRNQNDDGSWECGLLFFGGVKKGMYTGSAEATTGFVLEALAKYQHI